MKYSWLLVLIAGLNSTFGNILLKKSQLKYSFFQSLFSLEFISGCFFYMINVLLFAYSLKHLEVTKAYPVLSGFAFLTLSFSSYFFLDERLNIVNYFGMFLILIGIILITIK